MKREIKFRAWCLTDDGEQMVHFERMVFDNGLWFQAMTIHIDEHLSQPMQFTGLTDRNGVEIYEGDILKWTSWKKDAEPYNNVVEYYSGGQSCGFRLRRKSFMKPLTGNGILNAKAIIIGNIYEHPELLKS